MSKYFAGIRVAQLGLVVNALLVLVKLIAGIVGNSYALIADAIESSTDIFSSLIVWSGMQMAAKPADEDHPYGHGKAESLAGAVVALLLLGSGLSIALVAIREIMTPHYTPAPFTLAVVAGVVAIKEILYRTVFRVGDDLNSTAVKADAWHHRSDAATSLAAFVGIALALWKGEGWESADDWAALLASGIILLNGFQLLRGAIRDLMDTSPQGTMLGEIETVTRGVADVRDLEKLRIRKHGLDFFVDLHVQAEPALTLREAHNLSGRVKAAIKHAFPEVKEVLIHMEPYEPAGEAP